MKYLFKFIIFSLCVGGVSYLVINESDRVDYSKRIAELESYNKWRVAHIKEYKEHRHDGTFGKIRLSDD